MTAADQNHQPKQAPASAGRFHSLVLLDSARKHERRVKAQQDRSGEVAQVFHDSGALERRKADVEHAARAAFKVVQFLIDHGAVIGQFCFMRRALDEAGNRTGKREPHFPVAAKPAGSTDKLTFTTVALASITVSKLRSWVQAGRTKVTAKTKNWAREAELCFRLADQVRDIIFVDDVMAARLSELHRLGLWRVVMETSQDNFQVLLKLPVAGGPRARRMAQTAVTAALGGDPRSTVDDKWHRLPGSYNNKMRDGGEVGIDWLTRLPITDPSNGAPVSDGASVPSHWLPAGWPAALKLDDQCAPINAPARVPRSVIIDDGPARALSSIKLPARVRKIGHDSTREFVTAAEYLKAGASLPAVFNHVLKLAEARGKYIKVKAGASEYVRRTLAGVLADLEHHLGAGGRKLFDKHEANASDLGCHPSGFDKAGEAAAERAGRRRKAD